jgi:hypothetical protein
MIELQKKAKLGQQHGQFYCHIPSKIARYMGLKDSDILLFVYEYDKLEIRIIKEGKRK